MEKVGVKILDLKARRLLEDLVCRNPIITMDGEFTAYGVKII